MVVRGLAERLPAEDDRCWSLESLVYETTRAALEDAGIGRNDLDGVVLAGSDQVDGRAITSMLTAGPAGAYLNDEINVASSPGHALALGYMQVLSGTHRRLVVSSWGKVSESATRSTQEAERLSAEPFFERDAGTSALAAAAIQAGKHRSGHRRPMADAAAAAVAAKNHGSRTAEDVLTSPVVALPLRAYERPPEIDGAFSVVLERDGGPEGEVVLEGAGWCSDSARLPDRDLVGVPHLVRAGEDALARAGITAAQVDAWELHDYTPDAEILAYRALGLCSSADEALEYALSGATARGSETPVNASGGSVGGEAPFGGPLAKVLRAIRQVRGDAGHAQIAGAEHALAQIATGFAGQFQSVFVVGRSG